MIDPSLFPSSLLCLPWPGHTHLVTGDLLSVMEVTMYPDPLLTRAGGITQPPRARKPAPAIARPGSAPPG